MNWPDAIPVRIGEKVRFITDVPLPRNPIRIGHRATIVSVGEQEISVGLATGGWFGMTTLDKFERVKESV